MMDIINWKDSKLIISLIIAIIIAAVVLNRKKETYSGRQENPIYMDSPSFGHLYHDLWRWPVYLQRPYSHYFW